MTPLGHRSKVKYTWRKTITFFVFIFSQIMTFKFLVSKYSATLWPVTFGASPEIFCGTFIDVALSFSPLIILGSYFLLVACSYFFWVKQLPNLFDCKISLYFLCRRQNEGQNKSHIPNWDSGFLPNLQTPLARSGSRSTFRLPKTSHIYINLPVWNIFENAVLIAIKTLLQLKCA